LIAFEQHNTIQSKPQFFYGSEGVGKLNSAIYKWGMIMFIDTEETRKLRQKYNLQMQQSGIKTFQDMDRIEMEALESGDLSQKYKELIALAISISKSCYG
jgi:alkylhydroperoxidase/carboxymuconolactone decarboxylase family protein YurZ